MSAATATIVGGAIAAAGSLGAAAIQSHAAGKAADVQTAAAKTANTRLDPYASAGYGAVSNLQGLVGRPATAAQPVQTPMGGQPTPQTGSGFVTIKAPTGEVQQVPMSQAQFYVSKGGQVVSQ